MQGSHVVLKVLEKYWIVESVFKTLKKYWNLAKLYIQNGKSMEIPNSAICLFKFCSLALMTLLQTFFCVVFHEYNFGEMKKAMLLKFCHLVLKKYGKRFLTMCGTLDIPFVIRIACCDPCNEPEFECNNPGDLGSSRLGPSSAQSILTDAGVTRRPADIALKRAVQTVLRLSKMIC